MRKWLDWICWLKSELIQIDIITIKNRALIAIISMKIPINDILMVYESIIADINIAEVSMILFTALDVDSVCTLKIITVTFTIFRAS